jgi:uncharacterized oligopeptide transporter (OPT) family protein
MALIQKPASTPEEIAAGRPLDIPPAEVAEMTEDEWYERAYRGDDVPQLTIRAVLMGSFLGFLLAFTNLYIGLKTGWHLGVAITACILSYVIWQGLLKTGVAKTPMSILENNCMQSTASAAGYSTGGTFVSAIAALVMLSATEANPQGEHLPWTVLVAWTGLLAILGVSLAIPMKRNMINQERLKFPSGLAAAATLQSLYASGVEATTKAKALLGSAVFGALVPLLIDLKSTKGMTEPLLPASLDIFNGWLPVFGRDRVTGDAYEPSDWTMTWDMNPVMIAAGMIVGLRVAVWMTIGALLLVFVAGPIGLEAAYVTESGDTVYATSKGVKAWKEIGLWLGAPIMVASGLLAFAFQWRTILRAFQGLRGGGSEPSAHADVEVPNAWFLGGAGVAGLGIVILAQMYFEVPFLYGMLAVFLTFFLALVAARATGESDITPTGAMGKIMQLTYGALIPQSATANLMTAGITAGAAGATADLLNDLKSGYLLGANPRRQFIAQASGIFSGTIATVVGFYLLVPDATALNGTDTTPPAFPAPAAQAWRAVAEVFRDGLSSMHPMHQQAILVGLIVGAVLVIAEQMLPKYKSWLPSATGLGLGFILPFQYPLSMLVGAVIATAWARSDAEQAETYVVPIASGVIAGVSIVGVMVAVLNNWLFPWLFVAV